MRWLRRSNPQAQASGPLWLVKDDPEQDWFCGCPQGIVDAPFHDLDTVPSGGTGWLFTCARCDLAFMFARARRIRTPLKVVAEQRTPRTRRVVNGKTGEIRTDMLLETPADWIAKVEPIAAGLIEGERYAFLDGIAVPVRPGPVAVEGLWMSHDLPQLPHLDEELLSSTLGNGGYWDKAAD